MAKGGRGSNLGKYIGKAIRQFSDPEFQEAVKQPSYIETIIEIMSLPFEKRREGDPSPVGNVSKLKDIPYDEFHIKYPEHYAALLRERGHMKYNADTSNRVRESLLEVLSED